MTGVQTCALPIFQSYLPYFHPRRYRSLFSDRHKLVFGGLGRICFVQSCVQWRGFCHSKFGTAVIRKYPASEPAPSVTPRERVWWFASWQASICASAVATVFFTPSCKNTVATEYGFSKPETPEIRLKAAFAALLRRIRRYSYHYIRPANAAQYLVSIR